ncbi:MAG: tetratricopeptide repeat protein [Balneolaceae bacterium]|nr:tetratricopeptide repeat protein [Balneolaceae bacterium]
MATENWQKIKQIFSNALEVESSERESFVKEACGDDRELLEEVQSLLDAHKNPGPLDKSPEELKQSLFARFKTDSYKDQVIGKYKIIREIGHGGMGSIFLARRSDGQYDQQVALKLLRTSFISDTQKQRFLAERQILASLIHKNIARLMDGGITQSGQPWFAMEYVEGLPIDEYCDKNHLTVKERLEIFKDVCNAVQFAHQKLIVHRDLKPSNIFVEDDGSVKLLDFGIAKALKPDEILGGSRPVTKTGLLPLTPAYASPEQIRGESITTASDIYQLGVLLYELLAGCTPYNVSGRSPSEIEHIICESIPTRPSTAITKIPDQDSTVTPQQIGSVRKTDPEQLQRQLRGELDIIVLKAMHKEPDRRYESAGHFASDINNYLQGKPVSAHPDSYLYRSQKFIKRHKIGVASTAVIILLLIGYAVTITYHSQRTQTALEQAEQETEKAEQVTEFMMGMFEASDPSESLGENVTARQLLESGINQAEQLQEQPEVQAQMLDLTGRVYMNLGEYEKADELLNRAYQIRENHFTPPHNDIAESLHNLGILYWNRAQYSEAENYLRDALQMERELYGESDESIANTMTSLAIVLKELREFDEAEPYYRQALDMNREIFGESHESVAYDLNNIGNFMESQGEYTEARDYYLESLNLYRTLFGDTHPRIAASFTNLGRVSERMGKVEKAVEYHRDALKIRRNIFDQQHPDIAESLYHLGSALLDIEEYKESEVNLKQALNIQKNVLDSLHPDISQTLNSLGILMGRIENYKASENYYRKSLEIQQSRLGETHSESGLTMNNLGLTLIRQEQYTEARQYLEQSLDVLLQNFENDHPMITYPLLGLAHIHLDTGEPEKAQPLLQRTLDIQISSSGENHWMVGLIKSRLGRCLTAMEKFEEAEPLLIEGYKILAEELGDTHSRTHTAIENLVTLYDSWTKPEKLEEFKNLLAEDSQ